MCQVFYPKRCWIARITDRNQRNDVRKCCLTREVIVLFGTQPYLGTSFVTIHSCDQHPVVRVWLSSDPLSLIFHSSWGSCAESNTHSSSASVVQRFFADAEDQVRLCACLWIMWWRTLRASHPPAVLCICSRTQCVLISHAVYLAVWLRSNLCVMYFI